MTISVIKTAINMGPAQKRAKQNGGRCRRVWREQKHQLMQS